MLLVGDPENGKGEEDDGSHAPDPAELAEVHDVPEVDRAAQLDGLVAHGVDQVLRDIFLVRGRAVLELHVGDQEGAEAGMTFLHLEGGGERVVTSQVAPPFAPADPSQDPYIHKEERQAGRTGHLGLGEEAPVDEEVDGEEGDEP